DQHYYVKWTRAAGKEVIVPIPDPGEAADKKRLDGQLVRKTSVGALAPVTMGVGAFASLIGLVMISNNGAADTDGVNHSGNRKVGADIAIGGAVVIVGGIVMMATGVGGHERLSVVLSVGGDQPSAGVTGGLLPDGLGAPF